jgi:putative DNA primase/helicase
MGSSGERRSGEQKFVGLFAGPDPAAQRLYSKVVEDADLVIVDNVSTLCRMMKENDADSWTPVQNWALQLRRAGKSVILVHHAGKSGKQRGTSRKEDVLDTIIVLRRPPDYSPDQGARFEVYHEKSRGFYGHDAEPFEVWLRGNRWAVGPIKAGDNLDTIKNLKRQGRSVREIAERTGLSKSTVQRKLNGHQADE